MLSIVEGFVQLSLESGGRLAAGLREEEPPKELGVGRAELYRLTDVDLGLRGRRCAGGSPSYGRNLDRGGGKGRRAHPFGDFDSSTPAYGRDNLKV